MGTTPTPSLALLAAIAVGGAVGTVARALLGGWLQQHAGAALPWGTFAVNLLGALVLGVVVRTAELDALSPAWRAVLATGVCGAFTTFSTFGWEVLVLLQQGAWARAAAYAVGSLLLGLAAVAAGLALAPLLLRLAR